MVIIYVQRMFWSVNDLTSMKPNENEVPKLNQSELSCGVMPVLLSWRHLRPGNEDVMVSSYIAHSLMGYFLFSPLNLKLFL